MNDNAMAAEQGAQKQRNRRVVIALLIVGLLPVVVSYALVLFGWRPAATVNVGELVQPVRPIKDVELTRLDGKSLRLASLQHKWLVLTFAASPCDAACQSNIYKMRQVHIALGKKQERVQRLLVLTSTQGLAQLHEQLQAYPDLLVVQGPKSAVHELAGQFNLPMGSPLDGLNRVYVLDTMNNLLMSYPADAKPKGMLKDLSRLLRASQIG